MTRYTPRLGHANSGFPCPTCRGRTIVEQTKPGDQTVTRYRRCIQCETRFTTSETASIAQAVRA